MKKVVIFGLGDISEIAHFYLSNDAGYEVAGFCVDEAFKDESVFCGLPVVAFEAVEESFPVAEYEMFIPLSYTQLNQLRQQKYEEAKAKGYGFVSYVSPQATVAENAVIGENCFIFEDNTIQPFVSIEDNCILWSGNHIGHHSTIKAHCFIASHVVISGGVEVGENTFIGVNATLRDHIKIGKANVIGAATLILADTKDNQVFMASATEASRVPSHRLRRI